jgi:hypothetical protein
VRRVVFNRELVLPTAFVQELRGLCHIFQRIARQYITNSVYILYGEDTGSCALFGSGKRSLAV